MTSVEIDVVDGLLHAADNLNSHPDYSFQEGIEVAGAKPRTNLRSPYSTPMLQAALSTSPCCMARGPPKSCTPAPLNALRTASAAPPDAQVSCLMRSAEQPKP
jgi:hypothetical protein